MRSVGFANRVGFTLVELLTVIGIIAVLIAMMLPTLTGARQRAVVIQCASNMRQVAVAWIAYADTGKGQLVGANTSGEGDWVWSDSLPETEEHLRRGQLWTWLQTTGVYRCPADPRDTYLRSYSIPNMLNGETGEPIRRMGSIRRASDWLVLLEENDLRGANINSFVIDAVGLRWVDPPAAFHRSGVSRGINLAFADGSVRFRFWKDPRTANLAFEHGVYTPQHEPDNPDLLDLANMIYPRR